MEPHGGETPRSSSLSVLRLQTYCHALLQQLPSYPSFTLSLYPHLVLRKQTHEMNHQRTSEEPCPSPALLALRTREGEPTARTSQLTGREISSISHQHPPSEKSSRVHLNKINPSYCLITITTRMQMTLDKALLSEPQSFCPPNS